MPRARGERERLDLCVGRERGREGRVSKAEKSERARGRATYRPLSHETARSSVPSQSGTLGQSPSCSLPGRGALSVCGFVTWDASKRLPACVYAHSATPALSSPPRRFAAASVTPRVSLSRLGALSSSVFSASNAPPRMRPNPTRNVELGKAPSQFWSERTLPAKRHLLSKKAGAAQLPEPQGDDDDESGLEREEGKPTPLSPPKLEPLLRALAKDPRPTMRCSASRECCLLPVWLVGWTGPRSRG